MVKQDLKETYTYLPPTSEDLLGEFIQNHRSYQEFKAKGCDKIIVGNDRDGKPMSAIQKILDAGIFRRVLQFLSKVDISKGPIERRVDSIQRRRDLDPISHTMKEHVVANVMWVAKDFNGNEIFRSDIIEGMYNSPITQTQLVNGKRITTYTNWKPIYDIDYSPTTIDKLLENNLNPPELIIYYARVSQNQRDGSFSLQQLKTSTWDQLVEISKAGKGENR